MTSGPAMPGENVKVQPRAAEASHSTTGWVADPQANTLRMANIMKRRFGGVWMLHDDDPVKGSPLAALKAVCPPELHRHVFGGASCQRPANEKRD